MVDAFFRVYRGEGKAAIPMIPFFLCPSNGPARSAVSEAAPGLLFFELDPI